MGRALTGDMPADSSVEDFKVYTAGVSTFRRRRTGEGNREGEGDGGEGGGLAPGTEVVRGDDGGVKVPDWKGGKGVAGGWECVSNGDCAFLSGGAERGWYVSLPLLPHMVFVCWSGYVVWLLIANWC